MKSYASLALLPTLAATAVKAAGIVDNLALSVKLTSLAATDYSGEYKVQNVGTGEYLHFDRPADTTNLVTSDDSSQTVTLGYDSAYGQSGTKWGTWSGAYITGLSKCMSAQWSDDLGVDYAAVSYACKVGGMTDGTETLEVAKQFWKIVPCGTTSDDDDDDTVATVDVSVQLNAVVSSGSSAASDADFTEASSTADDVTSTTSSATSSSAASTQSVDPKDRSTWVCRHPGKWLARHPKYVTEAGHIECADELVAYEASQKRRMTRRSRLAHGGAVSSARREKRASSTTYCIIAVDHLTDMATRALTPYQVSTAGGYSSLTLSEWDETDTAQQWRIVAA